MEYVIPNDLAPYFEYVPEEMLSGIITDALRAKINKSAEEPVEKVPQMLDIQKLLEQLQLSNQQVPVPAPAVHKEDSIIITKTVTEDVPEDLKSVVEDFMGDLFK